MHFSHLTDYQGFNINICRSICNEIDHIPADSCMVYVWKKTKATVLSVTITVVVKECN